MAVLCSATHPASPRYKLDVEVGGFPMTALREIRLLRAHPHPNVVAVEQVAVDRAANRFMLVMVGIACCALCVVRCWGARR